MGSHLIKKILVVDDEEAILGFLRRLLQRMGYDFYFARDGEEGLNQFDLVNPDVVFTDIIMPKMGGLDFLKKIREKNPIVYVVMMTGHSSEETAVQAAQYGVADYLLKPFGRERLVSILDRLERLLWLRIEGTHIAQSYQVQADSIQARFGNDLAAAQRDLDHLFSLMGIQDGDMMSGLLEVVINAIEHGNLEVSHETKAGIPEVSVYMEHLRERAMIQPYKNRFVHVSMMRKNTGIECVVEDEGPGFDWDKIGRNSNGGREISDQGRGMQLARALFDIMEYNDRGNRVRLVKNNVVFRNPAEQIH